MPSPSSDILEITKRFFSAIAVLKSEREITGLKDFCEKYELNITRYYELKNLSEGKPSRYKTLEVDALYVIASNYKFSLKWLFFGLGEMRVLPAVIAKCNPATIEITKISYR